MKVKRSKNSKLEAAKMIPLQKWLLDNFDSPYPEGDVKAQLAKEAGMTVGQVTNWYINARERIIKRHYNKRTLRKDEEKSVDI